jgi:hypothetical protein
VHYQHSIDNDVVEAVCNVADEPSIEPILSLASFGGGIFEHKKIMDDRELHKRRVWINMSKTGAKIYHCIKNGGRSTASRA